MIYMEPSISHSSPGFSGTEFRMRSVPCKRVRHRAGRRAFGPCSYTSVLYRGPLRSGSSSGRSFLFDRRSPGRLRQGLWRTTAGGLPRTSLVDRGKHVIPEITLHAFFLYNVRFPFHTQIGGHTTYGHDHTHRIGRH